MNSRLAPFDVAIAKFDDDDPCFSEFFDNLDSVSGVRSRSVIPTARANPEGEVVAVQRNVTSFQVASKVNRTRSTESMVTRAAISAAMSEVSTSVGCSA